MPDSVDSPAPDSTRVPAGPASSSAVASRFTASAGSLSSSATIRQYDATAKPAGMAAPACREHRLCAVANGLSEATIRRIEQSSGLLATRSVARMDEQLSWFRRLPPDQRSWVTLVAQAGVASFVEWLRSPGEALRLTGEVFSTAPREL